uniref:von Willebrand factor A domain-containing protein 1 n=1 Tax=Tetraodon nigroviridis TaxID=99883 RepID=H3DAZ0_TETNG
EGDILLLLDSSGSVSNNEFSRFLRFSAGVLRIFPLGRGRLRVGLVQVGTNPKLEFGLEVHSDQESLQEALRGVQQLQGDTNTKDALVLAQKLLQAADRGAPKILLWLTDGAEPGDVGQLLLEVKAGGVVVIAVSTVHGSHQLREAVSCLYVVDIDHIEIITKNLIDAITFSYFLEIFQVNRLQVVSLTPRRATLQWCPLLTAATGCYLLQYHPVRNPAASSHMYLPGHSSWVELTSLTPGATYTAVLHPMATQRVFQAASVTFSTPPECLSPAVVSVSDSGPHHIRVEWGPLQGAQVLRYTVEYGAIPSGCVNTVALHCHQNFTFLTGLEPATQYLVTVSAWCADGRERSMSVRACTGRRDLSPERLLADLGARQA